MTKFQEEVSKGRASLRNVWRTLTSSKPLMVGVAILSFFIMIAIFEPVINDYRLGGYSSIFVGRYERLLPMSLEHPLGTDHFGRDLLALQFTGIKYSLLIGMLAGSIATIIAIVVATVAGYVGGRVDSILNGFTNGVLVIPTLPILIVLAAYVRMDLVFMSVTLAFFSWPWTARIIRSQILSIKERPFVELAKISGRSPWEIMFFEIMPNLGPYLGVGLSISIIGAMFAETGLRLLGLGPGEIPTLGLLLSWSLTFGALSQGYYQMVVAPAVFLILIFVSFNLINVGLEEIFNPRLKKVTGT